MRLQGIHVTHQEFRYGDGAVGSRASEVFTSLQSGRVGQDCNGHGTHVAAAAAGLTYRVAKNASLLAVRSLECLGNGTVSQVLAWTLCLRRGSASSDPGAVSGLVSKCHGT